MRGRISPVSFVFAHFTDERLQLFLQAMKQSKLPPVALKAVLTEENKGWTILELHEELLKGASGAAFLKNKTPCTGCCSGTGAFAVCDGKCLSGASSGSTYSPFTCTPRCRCGPVTQPVAPERPMIWPCRTLSPLRDEALAQMAIGRQHAVRVLNGDLVAVDHVIRTSCNGSVCNGQHAAPSAASRSTPAWNACLAAPSTLTPATSL